MITVFAVEVTNWIEDYYEVSHTISLWETEELAEQEVQRLQDRKDDSVLTEDQVFVVKKMPVKNIPVGKGDSDAKGHRDYVRP